MDRNTKQTHIRLGNGTHQTYLARRCLFESPVKKLSFSLNPLHKKILQIEKKAFENPSLKKLITNSQMVKDELLNYYDINEEKIVVSHNGVEWDEMQKDFSSWEEQKQKHQKSLNLNPDYFNFLFVGNGFKRKGLKQLIYGLNLIKSKDFYLFVLGHDKNIVDYIKLVKKLGLSKNIFFFGISKDVRKFYQLSDCLVIPSFYDPFANVTLEALAMGLYIVTSKNNGAKEIINKDNGTIIEDLLNIDSISLSLEEAMKQRKTQESAQKIRNSAKKHNFTQQLDHFIDIIEAK
jgi:UDP-glucose:(heptosyl)LPS alpha-1,3-glucosyltransferase